jgi:3-oxoacyl-[acyl-carrier protein] reductase
VDLGLDGRRIVVTGASGGIGGAITRMLADEGARVAVHYHRNRERAESLAAEVGGVAIGGDLRERDGADELISGAVKAFGGVDACVANAGVWPREDVTVWEMDLDRWRETLDANLTATFLTCRSFLRHVESRSIDGPALVLVSSTAGLVGEAGHADYAAAKAAIAHGLLLSLKNEIVRIAPNGRVNAVAPGWTISPMTDRDLDPDAVARVTATMALRKVGAPEDVAAAVAWLLSPVAAGHVTGQVITVAGGMEGRLLHDPTESR